MYIQSCPAVLSKVLMFLYSEMNGSSLVVPIYQISLQLKQSHVAGICSKFAQLMWHQAQHPSQPIQTTSSESSNGGSVISQIMHGSSSSSLIYQFCITHLYNIPKNEHTPF